MSAYDHAMPHEGSHIWRAVGEHATAWVVGGVLLAATGLAPEEWLAHAVAGLRIPDSVLHLWAANVDVRVVPIAIGMAVIVIGLLRKRDAGQPVHAGDVFGARAVSRERLAVNAAIAPPPIDQSGSIELPALALPDKPSVAVLPFQNMSGDPDQDYFADGVVEDITSALSRVGWLFVIARNSAFTYKGRSVDIKQIGRELGVRYVMEGGVRKVNDRVRITAQLIEAAAGGHVWAEQYDRALADIFVVQAEIAQAVTAAISPAVASAEQQRALRKQPTNLSAWEAYQRGLWHLSKATADDNQRAQVFFRQAIDLDPMFAGGYAGLSRTFDRAGVVWHTLELTEAQRMAEDCARRAVSLDGNDAHAHLCLAAALTMRGDCAGALEEAERALAISPSEALAHGAAGVALLWSGEPKKGLTLMEDSLRRDPFGPAASARLGQIATAYYLCGDYEAAVTTARRAIRSSPSDSSRYRWLAASLGQLGRTDDAKEVLAQAATLGSADFDRNVRHRAPWFRQDDHEHMLDGLRKAGWQG